jgi:hypothetical protein
MVNRLYQSFGGVNGVLVTELADVVRRPLTNSLHIRKSEVDVSVDSGNHRFGLIDIGGSTLIDIRRASLTYLPASSEFVLMQAMKNCAARYFAQRVRKAMVA